VPREKLFSMRLSEEESARIARLAERYGLNAPGMVRLLLKREDDAALAPVSAKKAKTGQRGTP
jgi:hypothetical protein